MLESILEAFSQLQLEASSYSSGVQIWMKVMAISFLGSLFFVYSKKGARWILAAFVTNVVGLILVKTMFNDLTRTQIGTYLHLIFWTPILFLVWKSKNRPTLDKAKSSIANLSYLTWITWVSLLMIISIVLDARQLVIFAM
ncbi:MAG: putative anti-sigma-YlaC factor YlaD [Arenicella sp.]|jgi:predicted anti-sigma-YlaC factor YlaD